MVRIALFQSQTGIDPSANAARVVGAIEQAAGEGAAMVFTPEMSGLLDRNSERAMGNVRVEDEDQVIAASRNAAHAQGIWVHLGSVAVLTEGGQLANRSFVIDPRGEIRARYDKIHLFDVDLPTGESWRESNTYRHGQEAVVVTGTPVGTLGLTICYDLRFPALFQRLSEAGADVIAVPAAFTVPTGKAHWQVLLRARAIESACFVVAAAQAGRHEDGRDTYGHSLVADPWGEVLVEAGEDRGVTFAGIDLAAVAEVRGRIPVIAHRRPIGPVAN